MVWGERAVVLSYMLNVLEALVSGSRNYLPWQSLRNNLPALLFKPQGFSASSTTSTGPDVLGFSGTEPSLNLHFCSALLPAWQRKIRGSGPGVRIPPSLWSSHPPSLHPSSEIQILLASSSGKIAKDLVSPRFPWR